MFRALARQIETASSRRLGGGMLAAFALVHLACFLAGVRFDMTPLRWYWQYLDPELLRSRLLESLFYLHAQPPAFNLFLGLALKTGSASPRLFHALYLGFGAALYLSLFRLMRLLGVSRPVSLCFSTLFMISPAFLLYEHLLFYAFPLALLLVLSACSLARWLDAGRNRAGLAFFGALLLLGATWGVYHLACYVLLAAALFIAVPQRRKSLLLTAALPGLLLTSLYVKNQVVFGRFTASTWLGMNLWGVAVEKVPPQTLQQLVAQRQLSPVSLAGPFQTLALYPPEYYRAHGYERIPALRQVARSTGYVNFNHLAYVAIGDAFTQDAGCLIVNYPESYLWGMARAWFIYFEPGSDFRDLDRNRQKIQTWYLLYDHVVYGKTPAFVPFRGQKSAVSLFLVLGLPLVLGVGLSAARRGRQPEARLDPAQRILLLYLAFHILFLAVVGNALQVGENNRFRFLTDPFSFALAAFAVQQKWGARRRRRTDGGEAQPAEPAAAVAP